MAVIISIIRRSYYNTFLWLYYHSFLWSCVVFLSRIYVFNLFIYIDDQTIKRGEFWTPLRGLAPSHRFTSPKQEPWLSTPYMYVMFFSYSVYSVIEVRYGCIFYFLILTRILTITVSNLLLQKTIHIQMYTNVREEYHDRRDYF